ncbi:MAG: hypothetical protein ABSE15_06080 [Candidatus Bathyarchaeia archaeon]|jgi:hypothetical protein
MHLPFFLMFPAVDAAQAVISAAATAGAPVALGVIAPLVAGVLWGQAEVFLVHGEWLSE